jgi:hypothetical protein
LPALSLSILTKQCCLHSYLCPFLVIVVHILHELIESSFFGITDFYFITFGHKAIEVGVKTIFILLLIIFVNVLASINFVLII